jgi:hypothetical protein
MSNSIFLVWDAEIDQALREFYPLVAHENEVIQADPMSNGSQYCVGTSRLSEAAKASILLQFADKVQFWASLPEDFTDASAAENAFDAD